MNKDFNDFQNSNSKKSPNLLDEKILNSVYTQLEPSHASVFAKLFTIQALIGSLTLLFCQQFSLSLTGNDQLFQFFHRTLGHYGCMTMCGVLFVGAGAIVASYILTLDEIRKIRESKFLYYFSLSSLVVLVFFLAGAKVYVDIALLWLLGAMLGGISLFELNRAIRFKIITSL